MKLIGFQESAELNYPAFSEAWRFSQLESFFQNDLKPAKSEFTSKSHLEISGHLAKINSLPDGVSMSEIQRSGNDFWNTISRAGVKFLITIEKNLVTPLLISINRETQDSNQATLSYIEIQVKKGVKASLIEDYRGSAQGHTHSETQIYLNEDSFFEHSLSFNEGPESVNTHHIHSTLLERARYEQTILGGDAQKTRLDLLTELKGTESFAKLRSLSLLKTKSQIDLHSQIIHHSPDTAADQLAKNLLDGESKAIFTGKIKIVKDAQRVHSAQLNRNILKSKKAHAIGQPQLEIFADDVKCSHGSTTGRIGENELFYLLSRGISQNRAQELLSHAFIQEVFTESSPEAKAYFQNFLEQL